MLQIGHLCAVIQRGDEGGEECCVLLAEFGFQELDEVGDVPRDGHAAGHGQFRAGEEGFELAEEGRVRLRFEQGDEVAEERYARRGVGVGRSVQTPVRGENLAGFPQLAEHDEGDEGEHQIVAAVDGHRMVVSEHLYRCRCHSSVNRFSRPEWPSLRNQDQ